MTPSNGGGGYGDPSLFSPGYNPNQYSSQQYQQPQQPPHHLTPLPQPPQTQGMLKLKYRIIHCTSEEPEYPVTEVLDPNPNSRGWQSAKFCEFPQEIIV